MSSEKVLKKPRHISVGKVILFIVLWVIISTALIVFYNLLFSDAFGHPGFAMRNMFDSFGIEKVWDFIAKIWHKIVK